MEAADTPKSKVLKTLVRAVPPHRTQDTRVGGGIKVSAEKSLIGAFLAEPGTEDIGKIF